VCRWKCRRAAHIRVVDETHPEVRPAETIVDVIDDLPAPRAFFTDLHVHSNDTVGTQDTAWNLRYARDIGALDVVGYTANDFQITDEGLDRRRRRLPGHLGRREPGLLPGCRMVRHRWCRW